MTAVWSSAWSERVVPSVRHSSNPRGGREPPSAHQMFPLTWHPQAAGMRLTCGSPQQARPPGDSEGRCLARPGPGPWPPTGSADSGLWWPPAPAATAQSGQDKHKQAGPPCTGLSGPRKPEPSWAGGQVASQGGLRNSARERDEAQVSRSPPQPLHPRHHRQQQHRAQPGAGPRCCGVGGTGLLCARTAPRLCFLEEQDTEARPGRPGPVAQAGEPRQEPHAALPCSQPRPEGRTQNQDALGAVTQRLTTAPEHHVLPPAAKTGRQAARRGSGSRGRVGAWPRPAGADHRRRLKVQQAAALHPPEGTLAPGPSPRPGPSPPVEQPHSAAVLGQLGPTCPRAARGTPIPAPQVTPRARVKGPHFYTTREHRAPQLPAALVCTRAHTQTRTLPSSVPTAT